MKFSSSPFSVSSHNEFCVFSSSLIDYFPLYLNGGTGNYPSKQSAPAAGKVGMPWGSRQLGFPVSEAARAVCSRASTHATFPSVTKGLRGKASSSSASSSSPMTNINRSRTSLLFQPLPTRLLCRTSNPSSIP